MVRCVTDLDALAVRDALLVALFTVFAPVILRVRADLWRETGTEPDAAAVIARFTENLSMYVKR